MGGIKKKQTDFSTKELLDSEATNRSIIVKEIKNSEPTLSEKGRIYQLPSEFNAESCIANCMQRNTPVPNLCQESWSPPCNEKIAWCPSAYTSDKVQEACEIICQNQYVQNCSSAKYIVVRSEWPWGFGSHLHSIVMIMTWAVSVNRIMVFDNFGSSWTVPNDLIESCAKGNPMCYFRPITNCSLPANWNDSALELINTGSDQTKVQFLFFRFSTRVFLFKKMDLL